MDEPKPDAKPEVHEPQTPRPPRPGTFRLGRDKPPSPEMGKTRNDEVRSDSKATPGASLGQVPILSKLRAERKVNRAEKVVGKFVVEGAKVTGKLQAICGREATVQSEILSAKEAASRLSPAAAKPLLARLQEAETRLREEGPRGCTLFQAPAEENLEEPT